MNDLKFALRQLRKNPGFTVLAVLTLALGIGANTSIFSIVNAVLLKSLPYAGAEQLVGLWEEPEQGVRKSVSPGVFSDWREHGTSLEALSVVSPTAVNLTGEGRPERLNGLQVSASYLDIFRLRPQWGRGFQPSDDRPGQENQVVILTHGMWQRRFGGDPQVIGRVVRLNLQSYRIIGVLPPKPVLDPGVELLLPYVLTDKPEHRTRENHLFFVIGRLRDGVTVAQAQAELTAIRGRLNAEYPAFKKAWGYRIVPLQEQVVGPARRTLLTLTGAVGFVLLIACANVANLLLARSVTRQKELALRAALGATKGRVVRQLLTESALLSMLGGAAGLLLAEWGTRAFARLSPNTLPRAHEVGVDGHVLGFALLLSVLTGVAFGLAPVAVAAGRDLNAVLKETGRSTGGLPRNRLRSGLIIGEIALALVLLTGAGLLLRSLGQLLNAAVGFEARDLIAMDLSLPPEKYPGGNDGARFLHEAFAKLESVPGVVAAGMATTLPLTGPNYGTSIRIEGDDAAAGTDHHVRWDFVAGDYFRAMGIPLIRGRVLTRGDNSTNAPRVVVVNEVLARKGFGGREPLGQRIRFWDQPWEVVGVVGSVRQTGLADAAAERVYLPQAFCFWTGGSLVVRAATGPGPLEGVIRDQILDLDPDIPVANVRSMERIVADSTASRRLALALLGALSGAALLLAGIGLYGVMAGTVSQRTAEIGVRMALGARRSDVFGWVVRRGLRLALPGIVLGIAGAAGLTRLLSTQLYGVEATDPLTFVGVALLLLLVMLVACWWPARRATGIDPVRAMSHS